MFIRRLSAPPALIFTHHKCASTWLMHVIRGYCAAYGQTLFRTHLSALAPERTRRFDVLAFVNSEYDFCARACRRWLDAATRPALHVIRNPLDLVVSAYYSHLHSHSVDGWPELARQREILRRLDKPSGMAATWAFLERSDFNDGVVGPLFALRRWNYADPRIRTVRMEDLVEDEARLRSELKAALGEDPGDIPSRFTFEKLSGGRPRGVVDERHHFRCGERHQWLKELDFSLASALYEAYRDVLNVYYPEVGPLLRGHRTTATT